MTIDPALAAWLSPLFTAIGSIFMIGVAWSRGRLEGQVKALQAMITEWRQEDAGRWAEFKQGLERRIERIEDRLNEKAE